MSPNVGYIFQREKALFYIDLCSICVKYAIIIIVIIIKIGVVLLCFRFHGDIFFLNYLNHHNSIGGWIS